jgi:hypothetical protein
MKCMHLHLWHEAEKKLVRFHSARR